MINKITNLLNVAGSVGGRSVLKNKQRPVSISRKKTKRLIFLSFAFSSVAFAIALFAHPWQSAPAGAVDGRVMHDMFKMAGLTADDQWLGESVADIKDSILLENLSSPDGLAIEPLTGSIYVSEETAARIVRLDPDGTQSVIVDASTPVYARAGTGMVVSESLRSPEGLAFDRSGRLLVIEDVPGGRLIQFELPGYSAVTEIRGEVVELPELARGYAWESISVGNNGELLLAGSNMEAYLADRTIADVPSGAVLYRDHEGRWWIPIERALESFSGACFTPDGQFAYFISEAMGYVGCFDLRKHVFRSWFSEVKIDAPEGVATFSDGSAAVVSEKGKLYRIDPHDYSATEVYDFGENVESVAWDPARRRLIFSLDEAGRVVSLENVPFSFTQKIQGSIEFSDDTFEVEVPAECPDYLSGVLKMAGYDPFSKLQQSTFRDLVKNVALFAVDAEARLVSSEQPVADPIVKLQFAIFTPHFFGIDISGICPSPSGFAAVRASGALERTRQQDVSVMTVDLEQNHFSSFSPHKLALPHPADYRLWPEGTATVNFMGMDKTADYHIILNMKDPDTSYMVVMHLDGRHERYALRIPSNKNANHWIVGLKRDDPEGWKPVAMTLQ